MSAFSGFLAMMVFVLGAGLVALMVLGRLAWERIQEEFAKSARRLDLMDERLKRMESSSARVQDGEERTPAGVSAADRPARVTRRVDPAADSSIPGPTLIEVPDLSAPRFGSPDAATGELNQRFADIWRFADDGASSDAIARQTGHPIGQIELILGLRRRAAANPRSGES